MGLFSRVGRAPVQTAVQTPARTAVRAAAQTVARVVPKTLARAIMARAYPGFSGYEGASQSPRMARWLAPKAGPNALAQTGLATLRDRSRDMVRNNGIADSAVDTIVTNTIGTGIVPQFQTPDPEFNRKLAELWLEWTDEADADGRLDFYGLQALAVRSMVEAGEVFARLRTRRIEDGLSVPFQVQLIESEFCPLNKNEDSGANKIRAGIEFDPIGRRLMYHLYRSHPDDLTYGYLGNVLEIVPVPAAEVAHLASIRRPGMVRGEPWLTRALVKLHDLDKYDDAQLMRQQLAALFAGFVIEDIPEDYDENEGPLGSPVDPDGYAVEPLEPGTMQLLPRGKDVKFSEPPDPGNSYVEFMRQQLRAIAVSAGVLYEQLTGDYSQVNDRTFRASVNEFRRRCAMWQHDLVVFQFCRPVVRQWATLGILAGKIVPPRGINLGMIARPKWVPQGWDYINPVQDVQARTAEVRAGFRSRSDVVSERGYNVEQVDEEIAADNARADRFGIVLDSDPRKGKAGGQAAPASQADPGGSQEPDDPADSDDPQDPEDTE
ncbi:phage portal protein [Rhodoligotrophos ferricapiens]|uniref:phage portal protein n=1 Tax=Rhodoligotrophos ferricapiens TaxID=3069264 RepID=UPI00315CCDF6